MVGTRQSSATFSQVVAQLNNLFSYAVALSRSQADAEKLVQKIYLCAARAFADLPKDIDLTNHLYATARNIWVDRMTDAVGERCPAIFGSGPDAIVGQLPRVTSRTRGLEHESMRNALQRLPLPHREVIVLREFERLSYCEIVGILHCSAGTVWSRLQRARQRLRLMLSARRDITRPVQPEVKP
jgi:RNA polymerase sigma-70 factor (ECF subfamily)